VLYLFSLAVVYFTCYLCDVMKCNLENRRLSLQLSEKCDVKCHYASGSEKRRKNRSSEEEKGSLLSF
jgi:hypothetical protein